MKIVCFLAVIAVVWCSETPQTPAKVQVYSRNPGKFGEDNILICHVSGFHPPDISIKLMKDGVELPNANQTDLLFNLDWRFHLTKSVVFKPMSGQKYTCKVNHGDTKKDFEWESNM